MEIATDAGQVEKLRKIWHAEDIDSDLDYYLVVTANAPWVIRPHVVRLERNGRDLLGIARLEDYQFRINVGPRRLARPNLRSVVVTFGGIRGCRDADDELALLDALREPLRTGEAEAVVLQRIPYPSTLYQAAQRFPHVRGLPIAQRLVARRPASFEAFLANRSSNTRRRFRKEDSRLEQEHRVEVVRYERGADAERVARDMEAVAAKTYQRAIDTGHRGDALDNALIRFGFERGLLRVWMLYLDGQPVAFWQGTTYAGRYLGGVTGFDPAFRHLSVGRYTMHRMVADLCADPNVELIDLGQGDQDYKFDFNPNPVEEGDVILLARRPRALALGALVSTTLTVNAVGKKIIRSEHAKRIRAKWIRAKRTRPRTA